MIRLALSALVAAAIERIVPKLAPPRVILDRSGRRAYLERFYLYGRPTMPDGSEPFALGQLRPGALFLTPVGLYLHRFRASDEGGQLHNHPWRWAVALVLTGGYSEERRVGHRVVRRTLPPLSLNFIGHDDFHRVDLIQEDAWTLFLTGPKVSSWEFWVRETNETIHWRTFIARAREASWPPVRGEA